MQLEVETAAAFFAECLTFKGTEKSRADDFSRALTAVMVDSYSSCWYPESSIRGSGNRCIRVHPFKIDPLLVLAGAKCGMHLDNLRASLPQEIVMWVDPAEVSLRIGHERSPVLHLYISGKRKSAKEISEVVFEAHNSSSLRYGRHERHNPAMSRSTCAATYAAGESHSPPPATMPPTPPITPTPGQLLTWAPAFPSIMQPWIPTQSFKHPQQQNRFTHNAFPTYPENWVH